MDSVETNSGSKGKIILLKDKYRKNELKLACDIMAKGFRENGYDALIIDMEQIDMIQVVASILRTEMKRGGLFIFTFDALYHNIVMTENITIFDWLNYPVYTFLTDHPFYYDNKLSSTKSDRITVGCNDYNHIDFIRNHYPNIKNVHYIPNYSFSTEKVIPYEKRTFDLYLPGPYENPKLYLDKIENLPEVFSNISKLVIRGMLQNTDLTLEEALKEYLTSVNFVYSDEEFLQIYEQVVSVDLYIKSYYRYKIVHELLDAGICLTVCGEGWEQLKDIYYDKLTIIDSDSNDIEENMKIISDSKILLNIEPAYHNGTHERIFTAMQNKCVCLTNSNLYLEQNFMDNEEMLYYHLNKLDTLPAMIKNALDNPVKLIDITKKAYETLLSTYSSKQIARHVLNTMGFEEKRDD